MGGALGMIFDVYATKSYSQEGEDMILKRLFGRATSGFYVDVGAHDPRRFSNTFYFYKRGWRGLNIEPSPTAVGAFRRDRPRDINLQMGVAKRAERCKYYCFNDSALNTFDAQLVVERLAGTEYRLVRTIEVEVEPLKDILARYLPAGQAISFLSIDVEGQDFAVLESNDWSAYRPECVLVEALRSPLEEVLRSEIYSFMRDKRYELYCKTFNTLIFRRHDRT
jgi:FkbM family methyltransferase